MKLIAGGFIDSSQNDTCDSALEMVSGDTVYGDTAGTAGSALWYSFIGTADTVTASTCHSGTDADFDSYLEIYSGTCNNLFFEFENDDDLSCPTAVFAIRLFPVMKRQLVSIIVSRLVVGVMVWELLNLSLQWPLPRLRPPRVPQHFHRLRPLQVLQLHRLRPPKPQKVQAERTVESRAVAANRAMAVSRAAAASRATVESRTRVVERIVAPAS